MDITTGLSQMGPPMTFMLDGKQYVAIAGGPAQRAADAVAQAEVVPVAPAPPSPPRRPGRTIKYGEGTSDEALAESVSRGGRSRRAAFRSDSECRAVAKLPGHRVPRPRRQSEARRACPKAPDGHPDLSGIWDLRGTGGRGGRRPGGPRWSRRSEGQGSGTAAWNAPNATFKNIGAGFKEGLPLTAVGRGSLKGSQVGKQQR